MGTETLWSVEGFGLGILELSSNLNDSVVLFGVTVGVG